MEEPTKLKKMIIDCLIKNGGSVNEIVIADQLENNTYRRNIFKAIDELCHQDKFLSMDANIKTGINTILMTPLQVIKWKSKK